LPKAGNTDLLTRLPPSSTKPLQGSLDTRQFGVRALAAQRGEFAQRIAALDKLADAAKGEEKRKSAIWRR
jgi:hypothetical protein